MSQSIAYYLTNTNDGYAPPTSLASLQQWDNYQIYDLYCVDDRSEITQTSWFPSPYNTAEDLPTYTALLRFPINISTQSLELRSFLAVQAFSVEPITVDFNQIIESYYSAPITTRTEGTYADRVDLLATYPQVHDDIANPYDGVLHTFVYQPPYGNGFSSSTYGYKRRVVQYPRHPDYLSLLQGYGLDGRTKPTEKLKIKATTTAELKISYYRENTLESIDNLRTIDWHTYKINAVKGRDYYLNIGEAVLGTVQFSDPAIVAQINGLADHADKYNWRDFLVGSIPGLMVQWNTAYENAVIAVTPMPIPDPILFAEFDPATTAPNLFNPSLNISQQHTNAPVFFDYISRVTLPSTLRKIAANHNPWNNQVPNPIDINFDINHSMFAVDNERAFSWHVASQLDGSTGDLIMDSPRIVEIHAALEAAKYSTNSIDPESPRITNLGHLVEKVAHLLGYRPNENGEYIIAEEKNRTRRSIKDDTKVKEQDYGGNYYGAEGMLVSRLPNAFSPKGEVISGGVTIVHDIPQLLAEMQDQLNIALGLQESGAIEIKDGDRTYQYPNQLALLTDLALSVAATHQLAHQAYISSLVTQQQTGEIIGGMGLPTVSRVTNVAIDNKLQQIPYWGIAPQHSLARKIDTVAYNVGIVTGQLV